MKIIHKNKKEDIKLLIDLGADYHGEDVVLIFSAGQYGLNKFVCSYVGGVQTNCVVNNSTVLCLLDNHGLSLGMLSVEIDIRVPDTQMPDGDFRHVTQKIASFVLGGEECSLELTNGASDYFPEELVPESVINLLPTVIKGEPGKDADIEGCNAAIASVKKLEETVAKAEAERKKAENERQSSETERKQSEESRLQSESERNKAEASRSTAETLRTSAEDTRTEAENLRITKEAERTKAETARQKAENLRVSNETKRTESEAARSEAENTRAAAETLRANAEKLRANAEKLRIVNENERKEAETARVNAEELRANDEISRSNAETQRAEAERQRAAAEAARQTAESSRDEAETIRQQNETASEQAETLRAEAEVERQQAENIRKQKESERQESEQERIVNNENCVTATNAALSAAQDATTAANNAMEVAATAEATIAKSEKAASDAASAVGDANKAVETANNANKAATTAATNANTAAENANAAAERANEAADLVYNGPEEVVSVALYSAVEGVSTSGLDLYVYINDNSVPLIYTTNEDGMATFRVTKGLRYDIVFPDITGCAPIGRLSYTAALQTRGIEVTYREYVVASKERVTIAFRKYPENTTWNGGEIYADGIAYVTINGVETVYHADSDGFIMFEVPIGEEYNVRVEKPDGLHLLSGVYSSTYTAEGGSRFIPVSFHLYLSSFLIVDADGGEWTMDGWEAAGKEASEAKLLHVATEELLAAGCDFFMSLDMMSYGKYDTTGETIKTMAWAVQNVEFTSIPLNGNDATKDYYYDGLTATNLIVDEGTNRGIATPCHTATLRQTFTLGLETLKGFTLSYGQWAVMIANYSYINSIVTAMRPDGDVVTKFWGINKGVSAQSSATTAWYVGRYIGPNLKDIGYFFAPFSAYAKSSL